MRWLLDGDPAIRWQALGDLVGAAVRGVERERRKIARDGWGARLLARQGSEGAWAVVGRRALLAKVDLHDVHNADAP